MSEIDTAQAILDGFDFSALLEMVQSLFAALICVTLHELSHGYTAYLLGDSTAKEQGRLSLNPLRHIDPTGFLMMVFFRFGWAKPVLVNMQNFKNPKREMALTALAGPASNMIIAALFMFVYGVLYLPFCFSAFGGFMLQTFVLTAYLSISLGIFNIIPIPPLDGAKVFGAIIPDRVYYKLLRFEKYGMILLVILVVTGVLSRPLSVATSYLFDSLAFISQLGYKLTFFFFYK